MASDFVGWLEVELQAQRRFVMSALSIFGALVLRWRGCLKREDSVPIAKVVFNVFFPALLFGRIAKTEFSAGLMNVACTSMLVHLLMVLAIVPLARVLPAHKGFRGQWTMNVIGCNLGFSYPLILSAGDIADDVFPALVTWDLAGNCFVIFIVNAFVALVYSPLREDEAKPSLDEEHGRLTFLEGTPATCGQRSSALAQAQATPQAAPSSAGEGGCVITADDVQPEAPGPEAGSAPEETQTVAAMDEGEAPVQATSSLTSTPSFGKVNSSVLLALAAGTGVSPERVRVAGRSRAAFVRRTFLAAATNTPLLAMLAGLAVSCSGWRLSPGTDGVLEGMGEPFGCLFFILVGLNLSLSSVRRTGGQLCLTIGSRGALHATALGLVWATGVIPQRHSLQAVTLALCCPVPGVTLAYVLDYGYDRSLQAALTGTTNIISLVLLYAILSFHHEG